MANIENVIKGLEKWIDDPLARNTEIKPQLVYDALELLKEQKKLLDLQHSAMRGSADMIELLFHKLDGIVLCKDCKYRGNKLCPFYQKYQGEKYDDWYCADGKRSE